jgi:tetratricopeptide (TPR) repeat protein
MKWALPFVCGLAGGVAGVLLVRALEPAPAQVRVAAPEPRVAPAIDEAALALMVRAEVQRVLAHVEPRAVPAAATARPSEEEGPGEEGLETAPAAPEQSIEDLMRSLRGRKLGPDDTNRLFAWLTVRKDRIGSVIAAIQKEIEADPANPELQVALATAYVADLTNNTMPGPQQGIVWMKASAAYDAAIKLEPEHWTARFGKAFGTSMAPEFIGMRPEAIRQFEELLEIQKRKPRDPHFADTYFRLGTLYKDTGNIEKARELWSEGLRQFPDNEELKGTIEASTKR